MILRSFLKKGLSLVFSVLSSPLLLVYFSLSSIFGKSNCFPGLSQLISLVPGKTGSYFRASIYRYVLTKCDQDVVISFATLFSQVDSEIGSGTYIGPQCNIGRSRIGKNCLIGSGVHILSGKQQHSFDRIDIPIKDQGGRLVKIDIGEGVWIGNGSIVMAEIGSHSIVGAGSVVINAVAPFSIVAGNPAAIIGSREEHE